MFCYSSNHDCNLWSYTVKISLLTTECCVLMTRCLSQIQFKWVQIDYFFYDSIVVLFYIRVDEYVRVRSIRQSIAASQRRTLSNASQCAHLINCKILTYQIDYHDHFWVSFFSWKSCLELSKAHKTFCSVINRNLLRSTIFFPYFW